VWSGILSEKLLKVIIQRKPQTLIGLASQDPSGTYDKGPRIIPSWPWKGEVKINHLKLDQNILLNKGLT
jgi:hypothetical protein